MTLNDIRLHLQGGGRVKEIKDDGRCTVYNSPVTDDTMTLNQLMELFAFRSAAGVSIFRLL